MRPPSSIVLAGAQYLGLATQFITGPLLARALGPEHRGVLAVSLVIVGIAPLIFGLGAPAIFRASAAKGYANQRVRKILLWSTVLATALCLPLGIAVANWMKLSGESFWSVALMITVSGLTVWRTGILSSSLVTSDTWIIARNHLLNGSITLFGIGTLFITGHLNLVTAALTYGATSTLTTMTLMARGHWQTTSQGRIPRSYGLHALTGQLGEAGLVRIDQILVIVFLGNAWAGQYSVAYSYAYMMLPLMYAVATRFVSGKSMESSKISNNKKALVVQGCVGLLLASGMAILAKYVITLLFGPQYTDAIPLARALCISMAIMGLIYLIMQFNHSSARAEVNSKCSLAGFMVIILLAPYLSDISGALGIAISTIIGVSLCCILLIFSGFRKPKIQNIVNKGL